MVACDVVWAQVRAQFPDGSLFDDAMRALGIEYDPLARATAAEAGTRWRRYHRGRARGARARLVADFLIGAHALHQADALLARDRGFWRDGWEDLVAIDPSRDSPPG
ncbi:MAG TPA: hypothetical protein VMN39_11325 [Longimicrobiaceae bacterium]|nr:hypothetical protein [Longimicrobiaceae bacterium]